MMNRTELFETMAEFLTNEIVVLTMGAMTEWPWISPKTLSFTVGGAMGYASSVGLGLAMARPERKVIVLDGDGSLLMNLGSLVTISGEATPNLILCVLENGMYELPGEIPIPAVDKVNFCGLAKAAGLSQAHEFSDLRVFRERFPFVLREPGLTFLDLKVATAKKQPVKTISVYDEIRKLEKALQS